MKNVIIYSGIALVIWTNSTNTSFDVKTRVVALQESKKEMLVNKGFKTVALNESVSNSKKTIDIEQPKSIKTQNTLFKKFSKNNAKQTKWSGRTNRSSFYTKNQ